MQVRHSDKVRKNALLVLLEREQKVAAPCPHFLEGCGGCLMQDYSYAAQVKAKQQYLRDLYKQELILHASPEALGYRNRMDFVKAFGKNGLRRRGKYAQVVDVQDCMLLSDAARGAYVLTRGILIAHNVQDYNYIRHEGFCKYVVIRTNRRTNEMMVILTTVDPTPEQEDSFKVILEEIRLKTGAASLWWTIAKGKADVSVGDPYLHLGKDHIIDEIGDKQFKILPNTFFQANTMMATELFTRAAAYAHGNILDLYCGVGVISMLVAHNADKVMGVELNAESIRMARENALLNNVRNVEFFAGDAALWLAQNTAHFDTVICDPARPGLGKAACAQLLTLAPKRIIYISCNPVTHQDDLALLAEQYDVTVLEGYDLFPQTPHVEMLSVLERKV